MCTFYLVHKITCRLWFQLSFMGFTLSSLIYVACWSRGRMLDSGARDPGFKSRTSPWVASLCCVYKKKHLFWLKILILTYFLIYYITFTSFSTKTHSFLYCSGLLPSFFHFLHQQFHSSISWCIMV